MKKFALYIVLFSVGAALAWALHLPARLQGASSAEAMLARWQPDKSPIPASPDKLEASEKKDTAVKTTDAAKAAATGPKISRAGYDLTKLSDARIEELAKEKKLTDEERRIILSKGTEAAFCGDLLDNKKSGAYLCRLCDLPLFDSRHKFDSGTGWPSFFRPFDLDHVKYIRDTSHGMVRVEIVCGRCEGHLGHVFDDAPQTPTGARFCLNSASLDFVERDAEGELKLPPAAQPLPFATAYFAGGCFWGVEDRFQQIPGVINAVSGYQGGSLKNPTYKQVCEGTTGHAETVKITYDPKRVSYGELLKWFFRLHDPTQLNRQGPDIGTQYRSAIFATTPEQLEEAKKFIAEQAEGKRFKGRKIVTQVAPVAEAGRFYEAEEYHQDYHEKHGGSCAMPAAEE
jgi:peptide methionine sulfoxide reductase msrA/msrB